MIFQKLAKKCTESSLHIDNEIIEIVQNYTYLGTLISSMGHFSMTLDKLKKKALHALFSLRKRTNIRERSLFRAGEGVDDIRKGLWIFGKCWRRGYGISNTKKGGVTRN